MRRYDPTDAPEPGEWLELDESERAELVRRFHRGAGIKLPNAQLHSIFHVIVENQLAMADARVSATLERLMSEGLDRHDSIHAIASILAEGIWHAFREKPAAATLPEAFYQGLEGLSAKTWSDTL